MGYHDVGRIASAEARYLSEVTEFAGASNLLLRIHGAFMLTAWIGTASVGILLARYFKQTWVGSSLCGKDQWFAVRSTFVHRVPSRDQISFYFIIVASSFHGSYMGIDIGWFCHNFR